MTDAIAADPSPPPVTTEAGAQPSVRRVRVDVVRRDGALERDDLIVVEEPLEIRVARSGEPGPGETVSVTMRTPGGDLDLAIGFLLSEGFVRVPSDVVDVRHCGTSGNVVRVELAREAAFDLGRATRHVFTSSSCGVCGKASIDAVMSAVAVRRVADGPAFDAGMLGELPARLRAVQGVFTSTGGLHATGLFSAGGELLAHAEDVGRHNAMDKLVGASFRRGALPLVGTAMLLSGRASFELLQKAMVAGAPLVAAIGAPSSLAIELAQAANITLVGFLRESGFNVYAHGARLRHAGRP
jgi:FdhD protein